MLISIDPAVRTMWWAYWNKGGRLEKCGRLKIKSAYHVANYFSHYKGITLAIEKPIIARTGRFGQARPSDIINLAVAVGWAQAAPWGAVVEYTPAQWKGGAPKEVSNARTWNLLSLNERAVFAAAKVPKSLAHNLLDGIGIGLFHLRSRGLRPDDVR